MTEAIIQNCLKDYYKDAYYFAPNIYFFDHPYTETDVLIVKPNGLIYDVEVKVSVQDYKADFKKVKKHQILKYGYHTKPKDSYVLLAGNKRRTKIKAGEPIPAQRPNRFYYCVPENLIGLKDLPKYAGLLYVMEDGSIKKVKEAKLLHKEKLDYEKTLCRKFYFRLQNCLSA